MTEQALVERLGPIGIIRFSAPPENIIANRGSREIKRAAMDLLEDSEVRVIVLTGAERGQFIRHADVASIARAGDALAEGRIDEASFESSPFVQLGAMLDAALKPVIAAIDGPCMGGGLEIALACTLRVASSHVTSIGLPEVRIGIFPGGGGTQRLMRVMSPQRARRFILFGEVVDAAQAQALGIVDEVAQDALARALQLGETLAARSPAALAAVLELARPSGDERLLQEARTFAGVIRDATVRERMRAFLSRGERLDSLP